MAGTMSLRRQRAGNSAISFFVVNEDPIVSGAEGRLLPYLEEGEEPPNLRTQVKLVTRLIQDDLGNVIRTDKADIDTRADGLDLRLELEEAADDVRGQLVNIRGVVRSLYGEQRAKKIVAIEDGPTAQTAQPELLWRQGEHTAERLEKETFEEPAKSTEGIDFKPVALAAALRPAVQRLAAAQEAVDLDRRQQQAVVAEKNRAIATFDVHFRAAVRWGVGLCRFADRPDLAAKLNTARLQAPGRGASDDEAPPPDPIQEGPSAPDEPSAGSDSDAGQPTS